jgi:hypothetical protein
MPTARQTQERQTTYISPATELGTGAIHGGQEFPTVPILRFCRGPVRTRPWARPNRRERPRTRTHAFVGACFRDCPARQPAHTGWTLQSRLVETPNRGRNLSARGSVRNQSAAASERADIGQRDQRTNSLVSALSPSESTPPITANVESDGLKNRCPHGRVGSSPTLGTHIPSPTPVRGKRSPTGMFVVFSGDATPRPRPAGSAPGPPLSGPSRQ